MKKSKYGMGGLALMMKDRMRSRPEPMKLPEWTRNRVPPNKRPAPIPEADRAIMGAKNRLGSLIQKRTAFAEGGKVKPVIKAISSGNDPIKKMSLRQLKAKMKELEAKTEFYDDAKNSGLKAQWDKYFNEAERRGVYLIDEQ